MKKNIVLKSFLLLIVISLMIMGFTGCGVVVNPIPTTGTVHVIVSGTYFYNIYMDYTQEYSAVDGPGSGVIYNVQIGNHFFEAIDTWGSAWGYDSTTQYTHAAENYVYLNP